MKVYIVQEDFDYVDENACGEEELVARRNIVGVGLSIEDALRILDKAVENDFTEHYTVSINDYKVVMADTETGEIATTSFREKRY